MKFPSALTIGVILTLASAVPAATQHSTPRSRRPLKQSVPKQELKAAKDFYCPSKEERGTFCPEGEAKVSDGNGCTRLMRAAESGRLAEVRALLAARADVNASLRAGHTALMLAATEGHLEIVKALLAAGADPNAIGATFHYGAFAAWMSAMNRCNKNWLEILDAMIAAGVNINPKSNIYMSPLGYAIGRVQDTAMIEALLKRGADVNLRDSQTAETPLMYAATCSSAEVVKALIDAGADVNARNKDGKTVLIIVENQERQILQREIVLLLKKAGARR
jgi:ankyrin repeat protein